jgi:hypothetical protein
MIFSFVQDWQGTRYQRNSGRRERPYNEKAVLRIHDISVWSRIQIWIRGSMPLSNGPGCGCGSRSCYLITELERYHDQHESKECRTYKLLGIHLDEFLPLDAHTTYIVSKLFRSLYCIKQKHAKRIIPPSGLKALYFALIHSHLTYCTAIMSILNKKNRTKIFKIQKRLFG